jgi:hypothetical protein
MSILLVLLGSDNANGESGIQGALRKGQFFADRAGSG